MCEYVPSAGAVKKASVLVLIQYKVNIKKRNTKSRISESFAPILLLSTLGNNTLNIFVIDIRFGAGITGCTLTFLHVPSASFSFCNQEALRRGRTQPS